MEGFICPECRQEFPDPDTLSAHYKTHHQEQPVSIFDSIRGSIASWTGSHGHTEQEREPQQQQQQLTEEQILGELQRVREESRLTCLKIFSDHLEGFISAHSAATYEQWITDLHPENAKSTRGADESLDHRFYLESSDHLKMWNTHPAIPTKRHVSPRLPVVEGVLLDGMAEDSAVGLPEQDPFLHQDLAAMLSTTTADSVGMGVLRRNNAEVERLTHLLNENLAYQSEFSFISGDQQPPSHPAENWHFQSDFGFMNDNRTPQATTTPHDVFPSPPLPLMPPTPEPTIPLTTSAPNENRGPRPSNPRTLDDLIAANLQVTPSRPQPNHQTQPPVQQWPTASRPMPLSSGNDPFAGLS